MNESDFNADQLADRLDVLLPPHQTGAAPLNGDETLNAAVRLANAPRPQLSPEMMARIQARVIEAAQQQAAPRHAARFQPPLILRWAAVFVLLFLALGAAAPAVAGSVPGELWYPVKRGLENVERLIASSPDSQAVVYLNQAERRLGEAQVLLERGQFNTQLIEDAQADTDASVQILAQMAAPTTSTALLSRAAHISSSVSALVQMAVAGGVVTQDEVSRLLPTPTSLPTNIPTVTNVPTTVPTATLTAQPSPTSTLTLTPSATPSLTPTLTATASPTPTPTFAPTQAPATDVSIPTTPETGIIISNGSVNVRQGPGTEFVIIAVLQPGTPVTIIGQDSTGDWEHVRIPDGRAGWIATSLVSADPIIVPPPGATAQPGDDSSNKDKQDCAHPGSYCNAPGQDKNDTPGDNGNGPGQDDNPGNSDHPPNDDKPGKGSPPVDPGNPDKPPKDKS